MSTDIAAALERRIVFCVAAVQFVNILDFVIIMPLGPDFSRSLGIPVSQLGYIGGSYTAAACVSGFVGALFLDRFDRRKALAVALLGLVVGTLAGAFATGLPSLLAARVLAGAFGGPATSLSYSIIADVVPTERRGKAMGTVMGAFAVASVLGVPAGLELARRGGWWTPFVAVAFLGAVLGSYAYSALPPMTAHLVGAKPERSVLREISALLRADIVLSLTMTFFVMASSFIVIPNIAPYLLGNLGYPRERLGILYLAGGSVSFFVMPLVGRLVDRFGSAPTGTFGVVSVSAIIYVGFVRVSPALPIMLLFVLFMSAMSFRNVSYSTLATKVPRPDERARFGSVQSAVQHLASALGAFLGAHLLREGEGGTLLGMPRAAMVSIALAAAIVPMLFVVEHRVEARHEAR